jgi:hypothetical protein
MEAMMVVIKNHKTQLDALTSGMTSTTPPALVDTSDKALLNEDDPKKVDDVEGDEDTTKKGDMPRGHSTEIPHPTSYVSGRHLQMPQLASCGPPPPLDASSFANWQDNMCSHINFVSIELWRIIEHGFHPSSNDLNNLQPWEHIDKQLNASALHLIHMSLFEKDKAFVLSITSAKEAWDALTNLFIRNTSIQESKFDEAHNEADNFAMLDGEDPQELHRRLSTLQMKLINLGSTQCDGKWMQRKFIQALLPFMKDTINSIKGDANFWKMTAHDILQEIVASKISEKNADDALARACGVRAPNLALKAKVSYHEEASLGEEEDEIVEGSPKDMKYAHVEHMALAQRAFMKKWRSSSPSKPKATTRVRTCYNCGNQKHFIVDCPYERVEDHNGTLVRKDMKPKSYPPMNSDKKKAVPIRALMTQEEHLSGDDASDDEEIGRAAIAKLTSLSSLFASANESKHINNKATCLMAHADSPRSI